MIPLTPPRRSGQHSRVALNGAAGLGGLSESGLKPLRVQAERIFCARVPSYGGRAQGAARLAGSLSRSANLRPVVTSLGGVVATSPSQRRKAHHE